MKRKTVAAWLAFLGGPLGLHRFYLHGLLDPWGWAMPIPTALGLYGIQRIQQFGQDDALSWVLVPLLGFTVAANCLTAIVYGLMSREKWNARFNPAAGTEAEPGVETLEALLRGDPDRTSRPCAPRAHETFAHQRPTEADATVGRDRQHTANRRLLELSAGVEHAQVTGKSRALGTGVPREQVPRVEVMAVGVLERTTLLDGEDLLPCGEHCVKLRSGELFEPRPLPAHRRCGCSGDEVRRGIHRAEHSAVGSSRRGSGGGGEIVGERAAHRGGDPCEVDFRHAQHAEPECGAPMRFAADERQLVDQ